MRWGKSRRLRTLPPSSTLELSAAGRALVSTPSAPGNEDTPQQLCDLPRENAPYIRTYLPYSAVMSSPFLTRIPTPARSCQREFEQGTGASPGALRRDRYQGCPASDPSTLGGGLEACWHGSLLAHGQTQQGCGFGSETTADLRANEDAGPARPARPSLSRRLRRSRCQLLILAGYRPAGGAPQPV